MLTPRIGLGGQPGFEDLLGAAWDHVQEPGGAAAIADGRHVQDNGDVPVLVRGVAPHVFIHAADAHTVEPSWIIDQQPLAFTQDSGVSGIPGHTYGLGDARHRQMLDDHARQHPAHRRTRELRARFGCCAHVLTPHVSTPLAPAASTPPILTSDPARQHCTVWLNALASHLQPQAIPAHERTQIRTIKDSIEHAEVFQTEGVEISIIERPQSLHNHDTPNATHNTYTHKCKEPL